jgi:hypothetical protein
MYEIFALVSYAVCFSILMFSMHTYYKNKFEKLNSKLTDINKEIMKELSYINDTTLENLERLMKERNEEDRTVNLVMFLHKDGYQMDDIYTAINNNRLLLDQVSRIKIAEIIGEKE